MMITDWIKLGSKTASFIESRNDMEKANLQVADMDLSSNYSIFQSWRE